MEDKVLGTYSWICIENNCKLQLQNATKWTSFALNLGLYNRNQILYITYINTTEKL